MTTKGEKLASINESTAATTTKPKTTALPQWHDALESATIENVSNLKQYDHGWLCTIIPTEDTEFGTLAILDITNRVRGENEEPKYMNVGPCPAKGVDVCKALLATMMAPSLNLGEFGLPRRPAWILLDAPLRPCLALVSSILATVDVVVKLNTPQALNPSNNSKSKRKATWDAGLEKGATPKNVAKLQQEKDEIWKCSMTMIVDPKSQARECFLAIEDITDGTDEENSYALGVGPCPPVTVNPDGMVEALMATMLSPRTKEGKGYGEPRRPGRVVLDQVLEPWLEHIQSKTEKAIGITVEV
mmetsp:Transcript_26033/g.39409  ORF Transcript_26033/g.39409 Transcript_26033/m.39409 type:complete len:302 (+) Transcript_26033:144-1049(+)|eukprot:CAMPEP_0178916788 /NCGR_PEP_ID=MMETSP0786-20121207/12853_1 /TAXON_ID=186022 /ORGANISM="Thalassionema frauenfeldii, Strain CCMP 1798" /LENGTH=301 /DNA_ID=CAMNT_0020590201 /DNA_START=137 /DNA_END=1042 /DNA_ORIENTATION=-